MASDAPQTTDAPPAVSKNKGGRPRRAIDERLTAELKARVRREERALIDARAAESNLTLSEFVRRQVLTGKILVRQFRTLSAIDRNDLARIGSNLNQIARACNASGDAARARNIEIYLNELRDLLSRLDELGEG